MEQINKIELRGNVGNVRLRHVGDNDVVNFSLAPNYVFKGKDGNPNIETTWHNITAWSGKGMPDFSKITKGSFVQVSGRLRTQEFDGADGNKKTIWEVLANRLIIIDTDEPAQPTMGK